MEAPDNGNLVQKVGQSTVIIALTALFFGCNPQSEKTEVEIIQNIEFVFDGDCNTLDFINHSETPVRFEFSINNRFPITDSFILTDIAALAKHKNVHETEAAWMYVINSTYHAPPYSMKNWQHVPSVFIGSIGGGFCDDRASVLVSIWKMLGYKARVVALSGHVVSEVFHKGTWQMFDSDEKVYFCDKSGAVMSVDDIASEIKLPTQLQERICSSAFFCQASIDTASAARYLHHIRSTSDNQDATEWHLNYQSSNRSWFYLPSNCSLSFISNDGIHIGQAILKLAENSTGTIDLPFVATNIRGGIKTNGNTLSGIVSDENALLPIIVSECLPNTEIEFIINGKLNVFTGSINSLAINSNNPIQVLTERVKSQQPHYQEAYLFFDTIMHFQRADLTPLPMFKRGKQLINNLSLRYILFNKLAPTTGRDTTSALQISCDSLLLEFGPTFEELLLENQPKSIHYLFLAHTYGQNHHLKALINDNR
jgi:hypothetical protein